ALVVLALTRAKRRPLAPAVVAIAGMTVVLGYAFLRGNLEGRLGDMSPPAGVLAAFVLGAAVERGSWRLPRIAATTLGAAMTMWAITTIGAVTSELNLSGLSVSPAKVARQVGRVAGELRALPQAVWEM